MTVSAPISFNAGTESGDRVSANTACWFALRRRTSGRPIAPLAPAIRIRIALPFQLALRRIYFKPRNAIHAQPRLPPRGTARRRRRSRRGTPRARQVYLAEAARCECRESRQAPPFLHATSAASRRRRARGSEPPRAAPDRETPRGWRADRDGR